MSDPFKTRPATTRNDGHANATRRTRELEQQISRTQKGTSRPREELTMNKVTVFNGNKICLNQEPA
jgi:hypothetical protein